MLAKDFYAKCLEEDRIIIQTYLILMVDIMGTFYGEKEYAPLFNGEEITSLKNIACAYLLTIARINKELHTLFNDHGIPLNVFGFSNRVISIIKNIYDGITKDKYYKYMYDLSLFHDNYGAAIIRAYSEYDKPICVERILINMIKNDLLSFLKADIKSLLPKLENIACQKEGTTISKTKKSDVITIPYGETLTARAFTDNPLIGREREFRKMCAGLMDEEKSLIIHGKSGVGKTTLVKGLAYKIQKGTSPEIFRDKQIVEVSGTEMVSGCRYVGMVEERLKNIINAVQRAGNVILFIDEIHTLMGLGQGSESNNDVSNILKPYLGDGRLKIIGATTTEEYNIILDNAAFARRFNGLEILEPKDSEVLEILKSVIENYQKNKNITIPYDSDITSLLLDLIISFSKRKNPNVLLKKELSNPDLALTILRNGYNYAQVDGKNILDAASLIEGFQSMDYFRDNAKKEFEEKTMALTRKLTIIK